MEKGTTKDRKDTKGLATFCASLLRYNVADFGMER